MWRKCSYNRVTNSKHGFNKIVTFKNNHIRETSNKYKCFFYIQVIDNLIMSIDVKMIYTNRNGEILGLQQRKGIFKHGELYISFLKPVKI